MEEERILSDVNKDGLMVPRCAKKIGVDLPIPCYYKGTQELFDSIKETDVSKIIHKNKGSNKENIDKAIKSLLALVKEDEYFLIFFISFFL